MVEFDGLGFGDIAIRNLWIGGVTSAINKAIDALRIHSPSSP